MKLSELANAAIHEVIRVYGDCDILDVTMDSRLR